MKLISEGSLIYNKEFFDSLKKLALPKVTAGTISQGGNRKSSVKGRGSEFSDFREYALGDDIRMLDWNAFGRLNKLYIKRFLEEREVTCHVLVDVSASMRVDSDKMIKALQLAGFVAYLALSGGDRVRIVFYEENRAKLVDECSSASGFVKMLQNVEKVAASEIEMKEKCESLIRTNGMCALISDFYPGEMIDIKYLKFYKKQQLFFIQVFGKEEIAPDFSGSFNLKDAESGAAVRVLYSSKVEKEYKKRFKLFTEKTGETVKKLSGRYFLADCRDSLKTMINKGTGYIWQ